MAELIKPLVPAVELLLKVAVDEAIAEATKLAIEDFERRLKRKIAERAIDVSQFYELHSGRDNLVISVKLPSQNTT